MGQTLLLMIVVGLGCARAGVITCCKEKTVGGVKYRKTGDEDTSKFGCKENCAYEKVNSPGPKFCFKKGNLEVECAGEGTATTSTMDEKSSTVDSAKTSPNPSGASSGTCSNTLMDKCNVANCQVTCSDDVTSKSLSSS